jgi:hypothetical protein
LRLFDDRSRLCFARPFLRASAKPMTTEPGLGRSGTMSRAAAGACRLAGLAEGHSLLNETGLILHGAPQLLNGRTIAEGVPMKRLFSMHKRRVRRAQCRSCGHEVTPKRMPFQSRTPESAACLSNTKTRLTPPCLWPPGRLRHEPVKIAHGTALVR